jgi:hypothetical protein
MSWARVGFCWALLALVGCGSSSEGGSSAGGSGGVSSGGVGGSLATGGTFPATGGSGTGGSAGSAGSGASGGSSATGGASGNFVPACASPCPAAGLSSYPSSPTVGPTTTDHPPPLHGDLNIKLRNWEPCTSAGCQPKGDVIGFVTYPPDSVGPDPKAPKLHTLFQPPAAPFLANYRMHDWDWTCGTDGCQGGLVSGAWEVTAVTFTTSPGQSLRLPDSGYEIASGGLQARALYVDGDSITLKYTGEDNVVVGYTLSIVGICPAPALAQKYAADDAAGRNQLPALHGGDVIGTACGNATLVTIRDSGTFMDPRSETDWWQGHP